MTQPTHTTTSSMTMTQPEHHWSCCMALATPWCQDSHSLASGEPSPSTAASHSSTASQIGRLARPTSPSVLRRWLTSSKPPEPVTASSGRQSPLAIPTGAIMAAALLLTRPSLLGGAILLRPLSPFTHDPPTRLDGTPVLVIDGEKDSRRSPGDGLRLAERLTEGTSGIPTCRSCGTCASHPLQAWSQSCAGVWVSVGP